MVMRTLRLQKPALGRFILLIAGIVFAPTVQSAQATRATRTPVALVSGSAGISSLASCIETNVAESGPVVKIERLAEGLEFRMGLRRSTDPQTLLTIIALLKPNLNALTDSLDSDAEAQPATVARFYNLLRVHVGTRAWLWQPERDKEICREAAAWIRQLRSRPILFDHIGADGEPREQP
jgi:hypothetical protein